MKHKDAGIGLVEVLIVLGLVGIVAGGAAPGVHRISREWMLLGGARLLENSLLWARTYAIASNDSLSLIIDGDGQRFYWCDPEGRRYDSSVRLMPAGIRIASSPRRPLRFYERGHAVPAGTFVIEGEAGIYRVIVSAVGRVRIVRGK